MIECPTCDGDGEVRAMGGHGGTDVETCPDCGGSGEVDPEDMREAAEYRRAEAEWQDARHEPI